MTIDPIADAILHAVGNAVINATHRLDIGRRLIARLPLANLTDSRFGNLTRLLLCQRLLLARLEHLLSIVGVLSFLRGNRCRDQEQPDEDSKAKITCEIHGPHVLSSRPEHELLDLPRRPTDDVGGLCMECEDLLKAVRRDHESPVEPPTRLS